MQSPCITYGQPETQLKAQKTAMKPLASLDHDPADRLNALRLAQEYGRTLYTGVFYRDQTPEPTYEDSVAERHRKVRAGAVPRERILDLFVPR